METRRWVAIPQVHNAYGSHKLGHVGPARQGGGFEASRGMKSGLDFGTFATRKSAEDWIIQADVWDEEENTIVVMVAEEQDEQAEAA